MKLKVCGMRDAANIEALISLKPDFIGFIFYEKSPRYVGEELDEEMLLNIPSSIKKVGVFVNSNPEHIMNMVKRYDLQYVQLHGSEMPDFCRVLRQKGLNIIKSFAVDNDFNFAMLNNYKPFCDLFLFDTKGELPGGSGVAFDWNILREYDREKPFLLSGGISNENIDQLLAIAADVPMYGIDVNSRFETAPGVKDIEQIEKIIAKIRIKEKQEIEV
ncbi:phosphoribosylanthranilate isomerase [Persicitalea jodogahamensis]|uniref:N-(5'-phosphoribosyl)anthranilate isomerase n=1 Tax=Persicitalea jodogahamensis TaxID=402147 RepID=A0A8J3GBA6_9BACT|nr:phosphoribosylanthranilate isomerase [Persicitalea jodogahamensis]GHB89112.1 N-(5'-phosphoribosyl)anthranilate isomerase [Persicitalea jodogahamensis]